MKTIRLRLTRKLLVGFALLLALGTGGIYGWTRAALLKEFDAELRAKALAFPTLTRQSGEKVEVNFSDRFMRGFDDRVATDFFEMWQADGAALARSESLGQGDLPCRFGTLAKPQFWNLRLPSGFVGRAVGLTFSPRLTPGGQSARSAPTPITLVVASDRRELDHTLATLALVLGTCSLMLLLATAVAVPLVLGRELAPLNQLAEQASRITAASLSSRFATEALPAELAPISGRLNDLLARLEQAFERERRFSADLAHELRTPIAELRSMAELALKWPEAREEAADRETLAIALQMEGVVTRLLALLRSERGQLPVSRQSLALAPLVEQAWQAVAARATAKRLTVSRTVPAGAQIQTDPVLLRSILANLLDNAVEYTPGGGSLEIAAELDATRFVLRLSNTVEHLGPEDLARLFERFWRKDPARSGTDHSGLGLSLSRAFAHALGYELAASFDAQSRLTLSLSGCPSAAPQEPIVAQR